MARSERKDGTRRLFGRTVPAAAWIAVGLLGAAVIAPATAVAASNLVGIVGSNGARAAVTSAGALETGAANPSSFVAIYGAQSACGLIYTVPKGHGLIVQSVTFNTLSATTTGGGFYTGLYVGKSATICTGEGYFLDNNPGGTGEISVPLTPGYALKSGTEIWENSTVNAEVYITGYLVPASAVPSNRIPSSAVREGSAQRRG